MNTKIAVAVGMAAIFAAMLIPISTSVPAFAATVNVDMAPGASTKTTDAYSPNPVNVNVGDTVIWTNNDPPNTHTATSGTPSGGPDGKFGGTAEAPFSVIIAPRASFNYTFTEAGEFPYYCTLHPAMVGTVMVAGSTGPAEFTTTATLDGNEYVITGKSETIKSATAEIEAGEAVAVTFDTAGEVELTLPKSMISGINAVMAGDEQVTFEKVSEDDTATTIKFTVPASETEIDIMGTMVIPEFPVVVALILGASIAAIIGYTRFAKGNTTGFFGRV
ncbi:MAG TPA: plastocyanin/azurin family copper-binding protein [Nitrososphaera sp.]|jgi:plastocyanin